MFESLDILTDCGYEVDVAYRGEDSLDLVKQRLYRLALVDYKLPCMNGVQLFGKSGKSTAASRDFS